MDEFEFIKSIIKGVPRRAEGLIKGIDDDAAVIEGPGSTCWLITTDALAEGVHFERAWGSFEGLGRKALLVNISDISAMGGVPCFYFVSVSAPVDIDPAELGAIFDGMKGVADRYGMILAGGDTTSSKEGLTFSITVVGKIEGKEKVIYRSGAKPGDLIYLSGLLGGSSAGLACLKKGITEYPALISNHLLPPERMTIGRALASQKLATSMIDISDGISSDIAHIADQSNVGFSVGVDKIPVCEGVKDLAGKLGIDPLQFILAGGEDYELLFTVSARLENSISRVDFGCMITPIGRIVANRTERDFIDKDGKKISLRGSGFSHQIGKKN